MMKAGIQNHKFDLVLLAANAFGAVLAGLPLYWFGLRVRTAFFEPAAPFELAKFVPPSLPVWL